MSKIVSYDELQSFLNIGRPMLMLDRLQVKATEGKAVGIKAMSMDEEFFQGHFPNGPITPGVLQIAAMTQAAGGILKDGKQGGDCVPVLKAIKRFKFRKPVLPGDLMQIEVEQSEDDQNQFRVKALVDGEAASQGTLEVALESRTAAELAAAELAPALPSLPGVNAEATSLDIGKIMEAIPHRYPFLLIDRVLLLDAENMRIVGLKNVTGNEPLFAGTTPSVLPESLQAEIAAQAGCTLALADPNNQGKIAYFMAIDDATFLAPVVPGDQLVIDVTVASRGRFGTADATLMVGERTVAKVTMKFAFVDAS